MPSNVSYPSFFHERQLDEKLQIACGYPHNLNKTIPATLLHPAFGQFIDDCQTHPTTEDDNNLVHELTNVILAFYENERKRVEVVSDVLARYQLGFHLNSKVQGMAYVMDADMSIDIHNHCHPFVIAEFKNKATTSTSEPYIQALLYYLESMRIFTPRPYIIFAGAILLNPIAFNYHSTDTDNQIASTRHIATFHIAVRSLERYHEMLPPESKLCNTLYYPILFPYLRSFTSIDEKCKTVFSYTEHLEEDEGRSKRLIFFLTKESDKVPICIKFIQHYLCDAHLHCWFMIVMDRILACDVLADLPHTVHLPHLVFEAIRQKLKTLHACKLVHGDICDTNILIPPDVRAGLPIKAAHYDAMIDDIIEMRVEK
ncbi:hypothetical protein C8R48DRAFT_748604 [Suillus tomentosus]|nr:hypothetical protein C8R48DRAFT_748604 [Suillus tomentosus]